MNPLRRIPPVLAFAVPILLVGPAGCGVPTERSPRPIPPADTSTVRPSAPDATASSTHLTEVLYLVKDEMLVVVARPADRPPTLEAQLDQLLAGPTSAERDAGLTSALTGLGGAVRVQSHGANAVIDLGTQPAGAGRSDEVLAYGQLVCTLTARRDVDTVSFRYNGQPVGVPRADGSLAQQPLTAADYADLIAPA
jgi:spore germination protein GerM